MKLDISEMEERVRLFDICAFQPEVLEARLNLIESYGFRTLLTMNMFGNDGPGKWWIICREKPEYERMTPDELASLKRALRQPPG